MRLVFKKSSSQFTYKNKDNILKLTTDITMAESILYFEALKKW